MSTDAISLVIIVILRLGRGMLLCCCSLGKMCCCLLLYPKPLQGVPGRDAGVTAAEHSARFWQTLAAFETASDAADTRSEAADPRWIESARIDSNPAPEF